MTSISRIATVATIAAASFVAFEFGRSGDQSPDGDDQIMGALGAMAHDLKQIQKEILSLNRELFIRPTLARTDEGDLNQPSRPRVDSETAEVIEALSEVKLAISDLSVGLAHLSDRTTDQTQARPVPEPFIFGDV